MIDTSKLDEPRWYVLHTFTGYENMAVDNLNKCIIKTTYHHLVHSLHPYLKKLII